MNWLVIGALLPSLIIAWLMGYGVISAAPRLGLVDQPGHRKVHKSATPLGGGLAIWLGVIGTFAIGSIGVWLISATGTPDWMPAFVAPHVPGLRQQL